MDKAPMDREKIALIWTRRMYDHFIRTQESRDIFIHIWCESDCVGRVFTRRKELPLAYEMKDYNKIKKQLMSRILPTSPFTDDTD